MEVTTTARPAPGHHRLGFAFIAGSSSLAVALALVVPIVLLGGLTRPADAAARRPPTATAACVVIPPRPRPEHSTWSIRAAVRVSTSALRGELRAGDLSRPGLQQRLPADRQPAGRAPTAGSARWPTGSQIVAVDTQSGVPAHVADVAAFTELARPRRRCRTGTSSAARPARCQNVLAEFGIAVERAGCRDDRAQRGRSTSSPRTAARPPTWPTAPVTRSRPRTPTQIRRRDPGRCLIVRAWAGSRDVALFGCRRSWPLRALAVRPPANRSRTRRAARPRCRRPTPYLVMTGAGIRLGGLAEREGLGAAAHHGRLPPSSDNAHAGRRPDRRRAWSASFARGPARASRWRPVERLLRSPLLTGGGNRRRGSPAAAAGAASSAHGARWR